MPPTVFNRRHDTKKVDKHLGGQRPLRRGRGAITPRLRYAHGAKGTTLADVEEATRAPALEQDR